MPHRIYVSVFQAPEIPAPTSTAYVMDPNETGVIYEFITDELGHVSFELPDGEFMIHAEKNTYRSKSVLVVNGAPSALVLILEEVTKRFPAKAVAVGALATMFLTAIGAAISKRR